MALCCDEKECRVLDKSDDENDEAADNEVKNIMSKWKKSKSATEEPVAKKLKTSNISPAVEKKSKTDSCPKELPEDLDG